MKDSIKAKAEKTNAEVGYGPNNPEPIQLKKAKNDSANDALQAIGEHINKSDC